MGDPEAPNPRCRGGLGPYRTRPKHQQSLDSELTLRCTIQHRSAGALERVVGSHVINRLTTILRVAGEEVGRVAERGWAQA